MLHKVCKPTKTLLRHFATRKLVREFKLAVQAPIDPASETEKHASDEGISCADSAA